MRNLLIAAAILAALSFLGLLVLYEVAVWGECLSGHPWWYCLKILTK